MMQLYALLLYNTIFLYKSIRNYANVAKKYFYIVGVNLILFYFNIEKSFSC